MLKPSLQATSEALGWDLVMVSFKTVLVLHLPCKARAPGSLSLARLDLLSYRPGKAPSRHSKAMTCDDTLAQRSLWDIPYLSLSKQRTE